MTDFLIAFGALSLIFLIGFVCGAAAVIAVALKHSQGEDEEGRE